MAMYERDYVRELLAKVNEEAVTIWEEEFNSNASDDSASNDSNPLLLEDDDESMSDEMPLTEFVNLLANA